MYKTDYNKLQELGNYIRVTQIHIITPAARKYFIFRIQVKKVKFLEAVAVTREDI